MKHFAMLILVMVLATCASAANHFVANAGDYARTGDMVDPWLTIQHALYVAQPGDTIFIRAGNHAGFLFSKRASTDSPIIVIAYQGEMATIDSLVSRRRQG